MKRINWTSVLLVGVLAAFLVLLIRPPVKKAVRSIGAPGDGSFVQMDTSTAFGTSTAVAQPTLILARFTNRSMAEICSPSAAATTTWLYFQNFASPTAALATVVLNKGYALAGGSCYSIRGSNLFITDVWATSTQSGNLITATQF